MSFYFILFILFSITAGRRVVIVVFPGGKNKNKNILQLITPVSNATFDLVVHKNELPYWSSHKKQNFNLLPFGEQYDYDIQTDIDDLPKLPQFKFYQPILRRVYQNFLDSDILNKINNIHYDLIITDRPNFISLLIAKTNNIENKMYLSFRPLPQLFFKNLDLNPSYVPAVSSEFTNEMTYGERCKNFFNYLSDKFIWFLSRYEIAYLFNDYGYKDINTNYFFDDALILMQYPIGITFPMSLPPSFITMNCLRLSLDTDTASLGKDVLDFLDSFTNNIIITKETATNAGLELLLSITKDNNSLKRNFGFIAFVDDKVIIDQLSKTKNIPDNLFIISNFTEDDYFLYLNSLLTHNNTLSIITNTNFDEICLSLSVSKPVISFGDGIYHSNINSYINKNLLGVVVRDYTEAKGFSSALHSLTIEDNIYYKSAKKVSQIVNSSTKAEKTFAKFFEYGLNNGYKSLNIPIFSKGTVISIFGIDVFFTFVVVLLILIVLIYKVVKYIWKKCKSLRLRKNKKIKTE